MKRQKRETEGGKDTYREKKEMKWEKVVHFKKNLIQKERDERRESKRWKQEGVTTGNKKYKERERGNKNKGTKKVPCLEYGICLFFFTVTHLYVV